MADLIRQMEEGHETADIDHVIDEVAAARGTYDTLDDRLDAMGGAPSPSSASPEMDGTASAGESDEFARGDHVHPHDTSKQNTVLGSWTPDTSETHQTPAETDTVLQALQKIDRNQRVDENNILSDNIISTSFTWGNGYASAGGSIVASSYSYFSQPFTLHAGEKIVVRTQNNNICVIGTTTADSVAVGDTISVLRTTSTVIQEETYDYTATEDIKIVISVAASNYVAYVANHNTNLTLGSYATAAIKRLENRVATLENQ